MASNSNKEKLILEVDKGFKRLLNGTKWSTSQAKGAPTRMFGERAVEPHGLS
ncbi:hypothetical protein HAX54_040964, partial [Datura stramonium]|nr:hypothetical protein [Datura stramonium]